MKGWRLPLVAERTMIGVPLAILGLSMLLATMHVLDSWFFAGAVFLFAGATATIDELLLRPVRR